jgi:hypothetical protein
MHRLRPGSAPLPRWIASGTAPRSCEIAQDDALLPHRACEKQTELVRDALRFPGCSYPARIKNPGFPTGGRESCLPAVPAWLRRLLPTGRSQPYPPPSCTSIDPGMVGSIGPDRCRRPRPADPPLYSAAPAVGSAPCFASCPQQMSAATAVRGSGPPAPLHFIRCARGRKRCGFFRASALPGIEAGVASLPLDGNMLDLLLRGEAPPWSFRAAREEGRRGVATSPPAAMRPHPPRPGRTHAAYRVGGRCTSTATVAPRTTLSATLPSSRRARPPRPCV